MVDPFALAADPEGASRVLDERLSREGADEVWLVASPSADIGRCRELNDAMREAAARREGRAMWLAAVSPMTRGSEAETIRCAELGAIGVGLLDPAVQRWYADGGRETWRLAGSCRELGMFVMIRSSEEMAGGWRGAGAREIFSLARAHPAMTIAVTALGQGLWLRETEEEARLDLSGVWYLAEELGCGAEKKLRAAMTAAPDKVIVGPDASRYLSGDERERASASLLEMRERAKRLAI